MKQYHPERIPDASLDRIKITSHQEERGVLAEYVSTARESVREVLKHQSTPDYPFENPAINSVDRLFEEARDTVLKVLEQSPSALAGIYKKLNELNQTPLQVTETEIWSAIKNRAIDTLQPELENTAWWYLMMVMGEIQYAQQVLLMRWLKQEEVQDQVKSFYPNPEALSGLLQVGAVLGKRMDQAHLKQLELHETEEETGESSPTNPFAYETPDGERSFPQIFKAEFSDFKPERIKLPQDLIHQYPLLQTYLEKLLAAVRHNTINQAENESVWNEVHQLSVELYQSGCPIVIIPYSVPGESGKLDLELRLGLRSNEDSATLKTLESDAQEMFEDLQNQSDLEVTYPKVPPIILNDTLLSFGQGMSWYLDGESGIHRFVLHENVSRRITRSTGIDIPLEFPQNIDQESLEKANFVELAAHEVAHGIFNWKDPQIDERIALSKDPQAGWCLEEAKAETLGAKLIFAQFPSFTPDQKWYQAASKVSSLIYYLTQKQEEGGKRYYYATLFILKKLIDQKGINLNPSEEKIVLSDPDVFFKTLSDTADGLLQEYYLRKGDPQEFFTAGKTLETDPEIQRYVKVLQS